MRVSTLLLALGLTAGTGNVLAAQTRLLGPEKSEETTRAVKAERCDLNVESWMGVRSDRTYNAPFYESTITVGVRVTPSSCAWRIDNTGKPPWINVVVARADRRQLSVSIERTTFGLHAWHDRRGDLTGLGSPAHL